MMREAIARERLQERIATVEEAQPDPSTADAMVTVLVLGASLAGKTYLLNQVLADKLPKGTGVSVGVGALVLRVGGYDVAVQVLDTPGDARFAPLGQVFHPMAWGCLLMYDVTSFDSFEALQPLLDAYLSAHPGADRCSRVCLVANEARVGMQHTVSAGYALEWCEANGDIPYFEVDPESPQAILEPLRYLVDEYITNQPVGAAPSATSTTSHLGSHGAPHAPAPAAKSHSKSLSKSHSEVGSMARRPPKGDAVEEPPRRAMLQGGKRATFAPDVT